MTTNLYDTHLAGLALEVEDVRLERLELPLSIGFTRVSTVVELHGLGHVGRGEDVTYDAEDHDPIARDGLPVDLRGRWTLDELSRAVSDDLFGADPPVTEGSRAFRRWACESAALDLALRQRGTRLADVLGLVPRPLRFIASTRLEPPSSVERLLEIRERAPGIGFKLDPTPEWDEELVARIAGIGGVEVIDLKGFYAGTIVELDADPGLYARVAAAFPHALLEDPHLTEETSRALGSARERISWDAPISSAADIWAQGHAPRAINVKPSRIGSLRGLFEIYEVATRRGLPMYGGGQTELGPGRDQIKLLASLFHPDGPNDVAPRGYNQPELPPSLPASPLVLSHARGFALET